jgi:transcriptional regulator with XRE-family HTH domain
MAISLDEVLDSLPPDRRAEIVKRGNELIEEYLTLQELRKKLNLTQEAMAELLSIRQANVSKVEKRADMLISTLRGYLEAMGGTLELIARVPGHAPVRLEGLGDLAIQRPG